MQDMKMQDVKMQDMKLQAMKILDTKTDGMKPLLTCSEVTALWATFVFENE